MASQEFYDGGQGISSFDYNFPSLKQSDIKVTVDGQPVTAFSISGYNTTTGGQVNITSGNTALGTQNVRVYRQTEPETLAATFVAGSSITANDLNNCNKQTLFLADENTTAINNLALNNTGAAIQIQGSHIADGSIDSDKIENLQVKAVDLSSHTSDDNERAVTTDHIRDSAVTTAKLDNNAVTDAKLATISGTKISPDFGSQNIVTTGTLNSGNITSTGITSTGAISATTADFSGELNLSSTADSDKFFDVQIGDGNATNSFYIRNFTGNNTPNNLAEFKKEGGDSKLIVGKINATQQFIGNGSGLTHLPITKIAFFGIQAATGNPPVGQSIPAQSSGYTTLTNFSDSAVTLNTGSSWNATTGIFTVGTGQAGTYEFSGQVRMSGQHRLQEPAVGISKNNATPTYVATEVARYNGSPNPTFTITAGPIIQMMTLAEGDTVRLKVINGAGESEPTVPNQTSFSGRRISE